MKEQKTRAKFQKGYFCTTKSLKICGKLFIKQRVHDDAIHNSG